MITLLAFLFVFGVLIVVHEFGHFLLARIQKVKVERFSLGFGPVLFKKKKGDTEYTISLIPVGGYVKLAGDSAEDYHGKPYEYFSKTPGERASIIFFGPLLNYFLGFFCLWLVFFIGFPALTPKVGGLLEGYGAEAAGVKVGDQIVSIDQKRVSTWEELQKEIYGRDPELGLAKLTVLRGAEELTIDVDLKKKEFSDELGQKHNVALLGIEPNFDDTVKVKYGFLKSLSLSAGKTWEITTLTYAAIWRLLIGRISMRDSVTGPLGILYITSKTAHLGIVALLHLMAVLSIGLAIFNLLPLPVLDGGHILLLAIEKIRGKKLNPRSEEIISRAGFSLIILIAVFVTFNDIMRFKDKIIGLFIR